MKDGPSVKINYLRAFDKIPYFTIAGFKQVLNAGESDTQRVRAMLSRWVRMGHIIRLKRGVYMTRRFFELHQRDVSFSPAVSSIILPQSYVSLEYVLQRASILTEVTYPITAITLKNTREIENALGTFVYRHIKSPLYTGFNQEIFMGVIFNLASVAKALFDYFYLRPLPRSLRTHRTILAEELRLNLNELSLEERDEFEKYIEIGDSPKMNFIHENLRRTVWQP
jgi:predicted transcriptional regulator of viral defense system